MKPLFADEGERVDMLTIMTAAYMRLVGKDASDTERGKGHGGMLNSPILKNLMETGR
jgi:hypothetical protein